MRKVTKIELFKDYNFPNCDQNIEEKHILIERTLYNIICYAYRNWIDSIFLQFFVVFILCVTAQV